MDGGRAMSDATLGHVLVVEDQAELLETVAELLESSGFSVDMAHDGNEALTRIAAREPDAVVADIEMPGMDGLELCRRVRASGHSQLPFLFCSGRATPDSRLEGLRVGADDYIVKPPSPLELVLKLRRQVERVRALRAATRGTPPLDAQVLAAIEERLLAGHADGARLGRFELRGIVGRGAMGTVFEAWDTKLERAVAVKTVRAGAPVLNHWNADGGRRLVSEAGMVARLNHPHVVAVHDVQDAIGAAYVVMELVEGLTLHELLVHRGRLAPECTVPLLQALASALAAAHAVELVHRDVKPGNVLLGRDGAIKLTDFGIASFLSSGMKGAVVGTPGYLPPETLRGESVKKSADLFALGAVAYRCLAGRPAVGGITPDEILVNTVKERVAPLRDFVEVPPELEAIVSGLLEPDPRRRITDAGLLAEWLARWCALRDWRWPAPDVESIHASLATGRPSSGVHHAQVVATIGPDTLPSPQAP